MIDAAPWPALDAREREVRDLAAEADDASLDDLRPVLLGMWRQSGEATLGTTRWLELFHRTGYVVDAHTGTRPTTPVTLYRAGHRPSGMAWTADPAWAVRYSTNAGRRRAEPMWTTTVQPGGLLALSTVEAEHVVDPAHLGVVRPWRPR